MHSLLLGETAEETRTEIQLFLENQPCVLQVHNLWAIHHGNSVMVTVKAELKPDMTVREAVREINKMERSIKQNHARVKWVFFEIDDAD